MLSVVVVLALAAGRYAIRWQRVAVPSRALPAV